MAACAVLLTASLAWAQMPTVTLEGSYDIQVNGNNSTWLSSLASRRVGGELRFLTLAGGTLMEFRLPSAFGQKQSLPIRTWSLGASGDLNNFNGLWFEQAKNRLWITSSEDYTTVYRDAHVTLVQLNDDGTVTKIGKWTLAGIPEKRVYGGCQPSPVTTGKYVCGFGGYTSLVAQAGGASMGPTMYEIPEPTSVPQGPLPGVRTLLDTISSRGKRLSSPLNYFDGGDARMNPSTPPTVPPLTTAQWLSPAADGLGWFVWGDSYYNTGMTASGGFFAVASLCKGKCFYMTSTLMFEDRQFELHYWPAASLTGANPLVRPQMQALTLPVGGGLAKQNGLYPWGGDSPAGNIAGAVMDGSTMYLLGCPFGPDVYTCRLYQFSVGGTTPPPPPPPPPTDTDGDGVPDATDACPTVSGPAPSGCQPIDAVLSAWSAWTPTSEWSACGTTGTQTRTEQRTRTVVTPAQYGGVTLPLSETRTESQACTAPPPPPPPPPANTLTVSEECRWVISDTPPDSTGGWGVQFRVDAANTGTRDTSATFSRTTSVQPGPHTIAAVWTKSGAASVTRTTTKVCD